jgi:hypothetical protein
MCSVNKINFHVGIIFTVEEDTWLYFTKAYFFAGFQIYKNQIWLLVHIKFP